LTWFLRDLDEVVLGDVTHSVQVSEVKLVHASLAGQVRVVNGPNDFNEVTEDGLADVLSAGEKPTEFRNKHVSIHRGVRSY
jgi:hypothetical protein